MDSLLNSIRGFNSSALAPTTTVEHGGIVVESKDPKVGHDDDNEIKEYFDAEEVTRAHAKQLAEYLRAANHAVAYTGAGISTAAKIPDYRGPKGVWTLKDRGLASTSGLNIAQAVPTFAHMALTLLYQKGLIKYVVSTNVDGLHRRSGLPVQGVAELHGNCYKEFCNKCGQEYLRDFDCTSKGCRKDHLTGRDCEKCSGGKLLDSIIHFGEDLPDSELTPAMDNANKADLALVLGTSMKVSPACKLPSMCFKNKGKLVICNLQVTPFDRQASLLMHVPTDIVLQYLLEELGLLDQIPEQTPEGFPIVRPAPYKPDELRAKAEAQMKQLTAAAASAAAPKKISVNLPIKQRISEHITGKKGETCEIPSNPHQVLLIRDCSDCNFTIKSSCMKLVIEKLENTRVEINGSVLTGTCEIISSAGSTIVFNHAVPTITVDKSTNCTLQFTGHGPAQFIWSNCAGLKLRASTQENIIPDAKDIRKDVDLNLDITQFITKWKMGVVTTELVIREGAGYATTEAEKRIHDENDARNEAMFARALGSMVLTPNAPNKGKGGER